MSLNFPASPTNGQEYTESGTTFFWDAPAGIWRRKIIVTNLNNLNDVTITSPTTSQILEYNGTQWVNGQIDTAGITDNAVNYAKLQDVAALSVVGRSANSLGDGENISAGTDGHVLRRSGTSLGFGQIGPTGIASDAVIEAKILDRTVTTRKLGPGTILQVVQVYKTDTFSTSSNTFVNIDGLVASITPRSATSKILVMLRTSSSRTEGSSNNGQGVMAVFRTPGSVYSPLGSSAGSRTNGTAAIATQTRMQTDSIVWLDTPNTTSTLTYQARAQRRTTGTVLLNRDLSDSDSSDNRRGTSDIVLMEVAG
jgi:hypothetical protein